MVILLNNQISMFLEKGTLEKLITNSYFASWYFTHFAEIEKIIRKNISNCAWAFSGADEIQFDLYEYYLSNSYKFENEILEQLEAA